MDRILLIEDDAGAQLLFRNRLEELGYEVVVASTGARGLLEARASKFDLFLVDIGLGSGIDGYEVCRRLKAMPAVHGVPVVLISGQVKSQEELHRGYEAGCEAFLVKGDLTLVEDVVRAMLRIKSLQNDLALQNRLLEQQNRRLSEEQQRGADLEMALRETGSRALVFRELAAGRPDGVILVDADGVVRMTDRGAQNILGKHLEGMQLASVAPGTGLEALVRDARTEPHEAYRFDIGDRGSGPVRSFSASVMPTVPRAHGDEPPFKVVLLLDAGKRRVAAEMLRLEEHGIPRREFGPLLETARSYYQPGSFLGKSAEARAIREQIAEFARTNEPVLIRGELGTGKEHLARILHFSGRGSGPFIPINCSALNAQQLESELFGHVKDAFPEAVSDRPGLFQQARNGSVLLDEVDALDLPLQDKLLEVLEQGSVTRMGSNESEPVDLRVIASTSADLEGLVSEGKLRRELAAHLVARQIRIPSLRDRAEDVELLAEHFLRRFGIQQGLVLGAEARAVLAGYDWPENVLELEHAIETACSTVEGVELRATDLPQPLSDLHGGVSGGDEIAPALPIGRKSRALSIANAEDEDLEKVPVSLELYERLAIRRALRETRGDKVAAAKLLKIAKSTFYRKLKVHGLD